MKTAIEMKKIVMTKSQLAKQCDEFIKTVIAAEVEKVANIGYMVTSIDFSSSPLFKDFYSNSKVGKILEEKLFELGYDVTVSANNKTIKISWDVEEEIDDYDF